MARRKQGGGGSDSGGQIKHHSSLFGTTLAGAFLVLHSPVFGPRTLYDPWAGACRACYLHIRVNASRNFGTKDKLGDSTEQTRKLEPAPWRSGMAHLPLFSHISRWDLTSTHSHTSWTRATTIPLDLSLPASSTTNSYFAPTDLSATPIASQCLSKGHLLLSFHPPPSLLTRNEPLPHRTPSAMRRSLIPLQGRRPPARRRHQRERQLERLNPSNLSTPPPPGEPDTSLTGGLSPPRSEKQISLLTQKSSRHSTQPPRNFTEATVRYSSISNPSKIVQPLC